METAPLHPGWVTVRLSQKKRTKEGERVGVQFLVNAWIAIVSLAKPLPSSLSLSFSASETEHKEVGPEDL